MSTYVILGKYTQQGISNIKASPSRLDAAREKARSMGAELKVFYLLMGQYDFLSIAEAPDDATAAKLVLAIAGQGNVTTETIRAFTEDEYRSIIASLP
jgi:uncharacterized protein with GYD domain